MERNNKIDKFIGIYDGYLTEDMCKEVIKFYEKKNNMKQSFTRLSSENISSLLKKDTTVIIDQYNIEEWFSDFKTILVNFDIALKHYLLNSGISEAYDNNQFQYTTMRIQKTLPTEGYHVWHVEQSLKYNKRAMAFTIYLNDVEEGGETEFLYQSIRVKPKTGRIVIWPAGFPFVHRGNSPISNEKYLITSWMLFN